MVMEATQLDAIFAALADPTRRRIIERLARRPLTVGEIAGEFSISQPGISKHVRVLEQSGLLKRQVDGRFHRCTLTPRSIEAASAWIEKQRAFWTATLDRLDTYLKDSSKRKKRK